METIFKLCKEQTCGVSITGLEKENAQYLEIFSNDYGKFRYLDTVSVNVMIPLDSKENEGTYVFTVKEHSEEDLLDQTIMYFPKDGLYRIIHAIVPNKNWKDQYSGEEYDVIYYYDNGEFFNEYGETVDIKTIINTNNEISTVFYSSQLTFSSCGIQECFYKYANKFLEDYCSSGKCYNKSSTEFNIIWIGMHVLRYLLDLNRLYEAQYVLEKIMGCTGVCQQSNKNIINMQGNGCGC